MRFEIGDKVKVRKDLENGYFENYYLEEYQKDQVFTINNYNRGCRVYSLVEDERKYWFSEEMLVPTKETRKEKFKEYIMYNIENDIDYKEALETLQEALKEIEKDLENK